jgi:hypothetical protein
MRNEVVTTPIMIDNTDRQFRATNVFERGNWLVKGKEVTTAVPHALNPLPDHAPQKSPRALHDGSQIKRIHLLPGRS